MKEIQIKSESLPSRCEICHQSDLFEPEIDYCSRCNEPFDDEVLDYIDTMDSDEDIYFKQIISFQQLQFLILKFIFLIIILLTIPFLHKIIFNFMSMELLNILKNIFFIIVFDITLIFVLRNYYKIKNKILSFLNILFNISNE